jgi:hypothetical protein
MNDKLKPALIGGVVLGLLSSIPLINWVNFCCCLWAILGGMLASYLYIKNSPTPVGAGDGAILGVIAGVIGGLVSLVVGIPVSILASAAMSGLMRSLMENVDPSQARAMETQMQAAATVSGAIIQGIIGAVLLVIFSTIGGLLGIPIFEKRKGNLTPPPPPSTGGVGGYAT